MTIIENVPEEKKKLKAFLDFSVPIKSTSTTERGKKGKKIFFNLKESTEQVKT